MQTPSTAQIHTAIEVLKKLRERLNEQTQNSVMQLAESQHNVHHAGGIEVQSIEHMSRIETVAAQLTHWRDELLEQRRQCVSHHV